VPKECFKFSARNLRESVSHTHTRARQTVPQPSTSSGEGSVSNSCTLRLADIQLTGPWCK